MEIRMARGDVVSKSFTIKNRDGTVYDQTPDDIYLTVKTSALESEFLFQKRLSTGGITNLETGKYQFTILPEDTNGLSFRTYDFDIEIVKAPSLKKTFYGKLILEKEVTHACNEGGA